MIDEPSPLLFFFLLVLILLLFLLLLLLLFFTSYLSFHTIHTTTQSLDYFPPQNETLSIDR
jgi:hypothetical protein